MLKLETPWGDDDDDDVPIDDPVPDEDDPGEDDDEGDEEPLRTNEIGRASCRERVYHPV